MDTHQYIDIGNINIEILVAIYWQLISILIFQKIQYQYQYFKSDWFVSLPGTVVSLWPFSHLTSLLAKSGILSNPDNSIPGPGIGCCCWYFCFRGSSNSWSTNLVFPKVIFQLSSLFFWALDLSCSSMNPLALIIAIFKFGSFDWPVGCISWFDLQKSIIGMQIGFSILILLVILVKLILPISIYCCNILLSSILICIPGLWRHENRPEYVPWSHGLPISYVLLNTWHRRPFLYDVRLSLYIFPNIQQLHSRPLLHLILYPKVFHFWKRLQKLTFGWFVLKLEFKGSVEWGRSYSGIHGPGPENCEKSGLIRTRINFRLKQARTDSDRGQIITVLKTVPGWTLNLVKKNNLNLAVGGSRVIPVLWRHSSDDLWPASSPRRSFTDGKEYGVWPNAFLGDHGLSLRYFYIILVI